MTDSFAEILLKEVDNGFGFVPLTGSGVSAPSGIPTGIDFGNYIFFYLREIVEGRREWNPRDPVWPRFDETDSSPITAKTKQETALKWLENAERRQSGTSTKSGDTVLKWLKNTGESYFEAIGSLADWRAALTFLSRLPEWEGGAGILDSELCAPNNSVVDSAFIHVTRDRQPTLAHMMLAHCADAMRIQTILTTNFDTLIEEAFLGQGIFLTTFDVHQRAGLPTPQLVLAQRSIVKLHGGRYGLRADYSLDEDPSDQDRQAFAGYFVAPDSWKQHEESTINEYGMDIRHADSRKHLIVMGVSGSDSRTMKLVRHAVEAYPHLKVFWVFHRDPGAGRIKTLVKQKLGIPWERFHCNVAPDLGLLLLDVYQRHYLSLPPSGADYAAHFAYPPDNYPTGRYQSDDLDFEVEALTKSIPGARRPKWDPSEAKSEAKSLIVVDGGPGVSSVASQVYHEQRSVFNTIWLELDQYVDEVDFLIALAKAVALKLGTIMVIPPVSGNVGESCLTYLQQLIAESHRPFLVFVNGRDGVGPGALWNDEEKAPPKKGNLPPVRKWSRDSENDFWTQLEILEERVNHTSKVEERKPHNLNVVALAGNDGLTGPKRFDKWNILNCVKCLKLNADAIFLAMEQNPPEDWSWPRQRFAFALTLFRKSRFPAALVSWGLIKATRRLSIDNDNDEDRAKKCKEYLSLLAECGAVRSQPGGMVWMHADVRRRLYYTLWGFPRLAQEEAYCHQGIADWYVKLFRSSNDPTAALESIYHRIRCAECAISSVESRSPDDQSVRELEITAILEAIETLELARDRILVTARSTSASYIIEQVTSRIVNGRKKVDARDSVFSRHEEDWRKLELVCEDLLRDFARTRGGEFKRRKHIETSSRRSDPPEASLLRKRQDADGLLHRRQYKEAEKLLEELFAGISLFEKGEQENKISWSIRFSEEEKDYPKLVARMRKLGRDWCLNEKSEQTMQLAVRGLRGYIFLQMLISQADSLKNSNQTSVFDSTNSTSDAADSHLRLRHAEGIYTLATSIMRYVRDHDFLQVENAYLRTHYGVLLAELGRFKEAHRRLNEAAGYLSQSTKATDGLSWAIIDLRRAETYLFQALKGTTEPDESVKSISRTCAETGKQLQKHEGGQLRQGAYLVDMRYALERAKSRFINHRKDVWWWTLSLELELSYFVMRHQQRRNTESNTVALAPKEIEKCVDTVKKGLLIVHSDRVRLARLLHLLISLGYKSDSHSESAPATSKESAPANDTPETSSSDGGGVRTDERRKAQRALAAQAEALFDRLKPPTASDENSSTDSEENGTTESDEKCTTALEESCAPDLVEYVNKVMQAFKPPNDTLPGT